MKFAIPLLAAIPWVLTGFGFGKPSPGSVVLVGGDLNGYLAPCGCTKPMKGGVRRWAAAVRRESVPGRTVLLHNGSLVSGNGRQDELKLGAAAEVLGALNVNAVNLSVNDARMGLGGLELVSRMTHGALMSSQFAAMPSIELPQSVSAGPFDIYAASADPSLLAKEMGQRPSTFEIRGERPAVLLLRGNKEQAQEWARRFPSLKLIVYSSSSVSISGIGSSTEAGIVSPGEGGKDLVKLWWQDGEFRASRVIELGPEIHDDPAARASYLNYLTRVRRERLIETMPRLPSADYAGSRSCKGCHAGPYDVWSKSSHAKALKTLEADLRHDQDPECIGCHVVGITGERGFRSRTLTPSLADVGCESCHGPAKAHTLNPGAVRTPFLGAQSCAGCHKVEHSPKFSYPEYWQKIEH